MQKIRKALDEGGVSLLIHRALKKYIGSHFYETFRYNTVSVRKSLAEAGDRPHYEKGLIDAIRKHTNQGEKVTIIGGGHGISGIVAKRHAGDCGSVKVFEPSESMLRHIRWVSENNDVSIDHIESLAVGEVENMWGENQFLTLEPENLNSCDILVIDSEGTEIDIIERLEIRPRLIIVETHPMHDSPTARVRDALEEKGYGVTESHPAEIGEYAKAGLEILVAWDTNREDF